MVKMLIYKLWADLQTDNLKKRLQTYKKIANHVKDKSSINKNAQYEILATDQLEEDLVNGSQEMKIVILHILGVILSRVYPRVLSDEQIERLSQKIPALIKQKDIILTREVLRSLALCDLVHCDPKLMIDLLVGYEEMPTNTKNAYLHDVLLFIKSVVTNRKSEIDNVLSYISKFLFLSLCNKSSMIREISSGLFDICFPLFLKSRRKVHAFLTDALRTNLKSEMVTLFHQNQEKYVFDLWCHFVRLLDTVLHIGSSIINDLMEVVETGFKSRAEDNLILSFSAWKVLIENFALNPDILRNPKRLQFLIRPLRLPMKKRLLVLPTVSDTYWLLVLSLKDKLSANFEQVCIPILEFLLPELKDSNETFKLQSPVIITETQQKSNMNLIFEIILRLLEQSPNLNPSFVVPQVPSPTFEPLEVPIQTTVLIRHFKKLVKASTQMITIFGKSAEHIVHLDALFVSLMVVASQVPEDGSRESVDAVTSLLNLLYKIISEQLCSPQFCLKHLESFSIVPQRMLISHYYHLGSNGIMHDNLSISLMTLLLNPYVLPHCKMDARFLPIFQCLCGASILGSMSPLSYAQTFLHAIESDVVKNHCQPEELLNMWVSIASPLLKIIEKTQEVNQGDSLESDFSCLYKVLLYPVSMFLPPKVTQTRFKPALKLWTDLYKIFVRCTSLISSVDDDSVCDSFCLKLKSEISEELLKEENYFEAICNLLQVIIDCISFVFTSENKPAIEGTIGLSWLMKQKRRIGNLTSLVNLVEFLLHQLHKVYSSCDSENKQQQKSKATTLKKYPNALELVKNLICVIKSPGMIPPVMELLSMPLSNLFTLSTTNKTAMIPFSIKLESAWKSIATAIQLNYKGPYDSNFLCTLTPLLEATLQHHRRGILDRSKQFWLATFASNQSSLKYEDSLKKVLIKSKLLLSDIPCNTQDQVEIDETNISESLTDFIPAVEDVTPILSPRVKQQNKKSTVTESAKKKTPSNRNFAETRIDDMPDYKFIVIPKTAASTPRRKNTRKSFVPAMYNELSQDITMDSLSQSLPLMENSKPLAYNLSPKENTNEFHIKVSIPVSTITSNTSPAKTIKVKDLGKNISETDEPPFKMQVEESCNSIAKDTTKPSVSSLKFSNIFKKATDTNDFLESDDIIPSSLSSVKPHLASRKTRASVASTAFDSITIEKPSAKTYSASRSRHSETGISMKKKRLEVHDFTQSIIERNDEDSSVHVSNNDEIMIINNSDNEKDTVVELISTVEKTVVSPEKQYDFADCQIVEVRQSPVIYNEKEGENIEYIVIEDNCIVEEPVELNLPSCAVEDFTNSFEKSYNIADCGHSDTPSVKKSKTKTCDKPTRKSIRLNEKVIKKEIEDESCSQNSQPNKAHVCELKSNLEAVLDEVFDKGDSSELMNGNATEILQKIKVDVAKPGVIVKYGSESNDDDWEDITDIDALLIKKKSRPSVVNKKIIKDELPTRKSLRGQSPAPKEMSRTLRSGNRKSIAHQVPEKRKSTFVRKSIPSVIQLFSSAKTSLPDKEEIIDEQMPEKNAVNDKQYDVVHGENVLEFDAKRTGIFHVVEPTDLPDELVPLLESCQHLRKEEEVEINMQKLEAPVSFADSEEVKSQLNTTFTKETESGYDDVVLLKPEETQVTQILPEETEVELNVTFTKETEGDTTAMSENLEVECNLQLITIDEEDEFELNVLLSKETVPMESVPVVTATEQELGDGVSETTVSEIVSSIDAHEECNSVKEVLLSMVGYVEDENIESLKETESSSSPLFKDSEPLSSSEDNVVPPSQPLVQQIAKIFSDAYQVSNLEEKKNHSIISHSNSINSEMPVQESDADVNKTPEKQTLFHITEENADKKVDTSPHIVKLKLFKIDHPMIMNLGENTAKNDSQETGTLIVGLDKPVKQTVDRTVLKPFEIGDVEPAIAEIATEALNDSPFIDVETVTDSESSFVPSTATVDESLPVDDDTATLASTNGVSDLETNKLHISKEEEELPMEVFICTEKWEDANDQVNDINVEDESEPLGMRLNTIQKRCAEKPLDHEYFADPFDQVEVFELSPSKAPSLEKKRKILPENSVLVKGNSVSLAEDIVSSDMLEKEKITPVCENHADKESEKQNGNEDTIAGTTSLQGAKKRKKISPVRSPILSRLRLRKEMIKKSICKSYPQSFKDNKVKLLSECIPPNVMNSVMDITDRIVKEESLPTEELNSKNDAKEGAIKTSSNSKEGKQSSPILYTMSPFSRSQKMLEASQKQMLLHKDIGNSDQKVASPSIILPNGNTVLRTPPHSNKSSAFSSPVSSSRNFISAKRLTYFDGTFSPTGILKRRAENTNRTPISKNVHFASPLTEEKVFDNSKPLSVKRKKRKISMETPDSSSLQKLPVHIPMAVCPLLLGSKELLMNILCDDIVPTLQLPAVEAALAEHSVETIGDLFNLSSDQFIEKFQHLLSFETVLKMVTYWCQNYQSSVFSRFTIRLAVIKNDCMDSTSLASNKYFVCMSPDCIPCKLVKVEEHEDTNVYDVSSSCEDSRLAEMEEPQVEAEHLQQSLVNDSNKIELAKTLSGKDLMSILLEKDESFLVGVPRVMMYNVIRKILNGLEYSDRVQSAGETPTESLIANVNENP